jgi:hypothetical protein
MPLPFRFYLIFAQTLLPSERKQEIYLVKNKLVQKSHEMCTSKLVEKIRPPHNALSISLFPNLRQTLLLSRTKARNTSCKKQTCTKIVTNCKLTNTVKNPYLHNALFISLLPNLRQTLLPSRTKARNSSCKKQTCIKIVTKCELTNTVKKTRKGKMTMRSLASEAQH